MIQISKSNKIPYGKQKITQSDIDEVVEVLKSDFITQGPKIKEFEDVFSDFVGSKYAVAVSSGTAALHLSALSLNVKSGQKIITSPITFAASANCIRYCNGEIVFSDINPKTYLLDIKSIEKLINESTPGTYKGIIVVDFAGMPFLMHKLFNLAKKNKLWIIHDACHSIGGYYYDENKVKHKIGNAKYADVETFSFHPVKHITTGEGGMITTNNKIIYEKLLHLRSHGITRDKKDFVNNIGFAIGEKISNDLSNTNWPDWYMEMNSLGYNYRMTDFQAALGINQIKRLKKNILKRKNIAKKYNDAFKNKSFILQKPKIVEGHAYHLYVIQVEDRFNLYNFLKKKNILTQIHYIPLHLMPYYRNFGWKEGDLPNSEEYYRNCISLPIYSSLKINEQNYVIQMIEEFYEKK